MSGIRIEVSPGELLDRISILRLKRKHAGEEDLRRAMEAELQQLLRRRDEAVRLTAELQALADELAEVNRTLWRLEDELRLCERQGRFDEHFVELARGVYHHNDRRALLKRRINEHLCSSLVEHKLYSSG